MKEFNISFCQVCGKKMKEHTEHDKRVCEGQHRAMNIDIRNSYNEWAKREEEAGTL